jgi:hypothetical protein
MGSGDDTPIVFITLVAPPATIFTRLELGAQGRATMGDSRASQGVTSPIEDACWETHIDLPVEQDGVSRSTGNSKCDSQAMSAVVDAIAAMRAHAAVRLGAAVDKAKKEDVAKAGTPKDAELDRDTDGAWTTTADTM